MKRSERAAAVTLCALLAACAGARAAEPRRSPNLISREELAVDAVASLMAFDAIQRLRPNWLTARGTSSFANSPGRFPAVLINASARNGIDALRTLPVEDVETLRFLDARDATTRFGTGYVNGIIEVTTRRGGG